MAHSDHTSCSVGIARHGGLPTEPEGLGELGRIANAFGAACTQSIGGVPTDISRW